MDFRETADPIRETLRLKMADCPLTEREQKYQNLINQFIEKIEEAQNMNSEAKDIFQKREENAKDKLTQFTKEIMEKTSEYKDTGTVLGKSFYKKDNQRFSSINNVISKVQSLSIDSRTIIEQYNDLRNYIRNERQSTYQRHLDGENLFLYFFRRRGILNSSLVDIYDRLLLSYTELQPSEYGCYYSSY